MALELTQVQAVTNDYWDKKLYDIFFTENVLLYMLMAGGKAAENIVKASELVDGGQMIRVFLEYGKGHTGAYGNTTKIPQSKVDIVNAARFRWAGYYASNAIDLDEQIQNSGGAQMIDLVYTKMKNIEKSLRDQMGSSIYSSASTDYDFLGLGNLFNTTGSTAYGTIAEDDMAQWAANVITTSRPISFKVMQEIFRTPAIGMSRKKKPNLCITTEALKDGYERTLQTQQRFSDQRLVEAGFDNILHKGAPVVADDNQTSGYLDALNTDYLKIKTHKDFNFTTPKWEYDKEQPDIFVANTRWIGQLICSNRKAHVRHTNLSEPN